MYVLSYQLRWYVQDTQLYYCSYLVLDFQMLATTRSVRSFTSIPSPRCATVLGTIEASVDTGRHVDTDTSERSSASTIWQDFVQVQAESLRPLVVYLCIIFESMHSIFALPG